MDSLVLIIDEDDTERRYIATLLAADGFDVIQVGSVVEGLVQEMAHEPALIVVAEETSPVRVDEVIALLRRLSSAPVIVVGAGGDTDEVALLESGGDYYLSRPVRGAELTTRARQLIQRGARDVREVPVRPVRPRDVRREDARPEQFGTRRGKEHEQEILAGSQITAPHGRNHAGQA